MSETLSKAMSIIDSLKTELNKCKKMWNEIDKANPHFDHNSEYNWQRKQARSWIYGTVDILESNELDCWRPQSIPPSDIASMKAKQAIKHWKKYLRVKETRYKFSKKIVYIESNPEETLIEFLNRMASEIEQHGWGRSIEERAFKSFLGYVRRFHDDAAFVEHIFPKKMELHHGVITRNIASECYPIPEELTCQILMTLVDKALEHRRKDTSLTALECLALCWICLTAARLKLPIFFEELLEIKVTSLHSDMQLPTIAIPTLFGPKEIPISRNIAHFLFSLASIPTKNPSDTFLRRTRKSLIRTLDEVLEFIAPDPKFGNITYVSLMTLPHHFGDHRYQCK